MFRGVPMPEGESGGLSKEFLKMRKLVLRDRARRERVLFEDAWTKAEDVANCSFCWGFFDSEKSCDKQ